VVLSPTGSINLGFTTEGNLLMCSSYLPLGVPNWVPNTHHQFVNLNPFMQQMFLKLHDIEGSKKKDFIFETLRREFRDVVIKARKVFESFNMLGSRVDVVGTNKEEIKVPIPCKLVGLHEALEKNFDWIVPENLFDEISEPKIVHKGSSKLICIQYNSLLKRLMQLILMPLLILLNFHFLRLAQRR
jgi:hypothetical protein